MSTKIIVEGGIPLRGEIRIGGSKNAALPLMAASLLTGGNLVLENVPDLSDIQSMGELLEQHGATVNRKGDRCEISAASLTNIIAPYDFVRKMRASILVLGPLLARCGRAEVSLPGGCAIGTRPVDIHLEGLRQLGASVEIEKGYIHAFAPQGLRGAVLTLPITSVTGTENLMMAACLARGETRIINAAREPEVIDLAHCLNLMGAKIIGAGSDTIVIEGVDQLFGCTHKVIPDRIETGTYAMAAMITGGEVELTHTSLSLLSGVTPYLQKAGAVLEPTACGFRISRQVSPCQGVDVMTEPFPGFATDLQAQMMAVMTLCQGASMITETIFENRFMHVPELCRMGANITVHHASALVRGVPSLSGASVMATDLRASVCLILAGMAARGTTKVGRIYHLDRGYERIEEKLRQCGAVIERVEEE